MVASRISSENL